MDLRSLVTIVVVAAVAVGGCSSDRFEPTIPDAGAVDKTAPDISIVDGKQAELAPVDVKPVPADIPPEFDLKPVDHDILPPDCPPLDEPCLESAWSAEAGECMQFPAASGTPCDDASVCTTDDRCEDGICAGDAVDCDDGNECTADECDPILGCTNLPADGPCEDGNPCTQDDACENGVCQPGEKVACNDGNPCTDDGCSSVDGCMHKNNSMPCDDGNECTAGDSCVGGACEPGSPLDCDDGSECTEEWCEPNSGCQSVPVSDGSMCLSNGFESACLSGTCVCVPDCLGKECGPDGCDGDCGSCVDGNFCTLDECVGGACDHQVKVALPVCCLMEDDCDDGNECSVDICGSDNHHCQHATNSDNPACCTDDSDCDDGAQGTFDYCTDGKCIWLMPTQCGVWDYSPCDHTHTCLIPLCQPQPPNLTTFTCAYEVITGCCTSDLDCLKAGNNNGSPCIALTCDVVTHDCKSDWLEGCCLDDIDCQPAGEGLDGFCAGNECVY